MTYRVELILGSRNSGCALVAGEVVYQSGGFLVRHDLARAVRHYTYRPNTYNLSRSVLGLLAHEYDTANYTLNPQTTYILDPQRDFAAQFEWPDYCAVLDEVKDRLLLRYKREIQVCHREAGELHCLVSKAIPDHGPLAMDEAGLYFASNSKDESEFSSYDYQLEPRWTVAIETGMEPRALDSTRIAPLVYQDRLVVSVAYWRPETNQFFTRLACLRSADGAVLWNQELLGELSDAEVIDGRLLVAIDGEVRFLDWDSGAQVQCLKTGFPKPQGDRWLHEIAINQHGGHLFISGTAARVLQVYDWASLQLLHTYPLPAVPGSYNDTVAISSKARLQVHGRFLVFPVSYCLSGYYDSVWPHGFLVLEANDDPEWTPVAFSARLACQIDKLVGADGSHGYRFHYPDVALEEVLCQAEWEIAEYGQYRAKHAFKISKPEAKFNGQLTLVLPAHRATETLRRAAEDSKKRLESYWAHRSKAPATKKRLRLTVEWV